MSRASTSCGTNAARATELCADAEQLLTLSGPELVEGARRIPALREAFAAAGELPRSESQALRNRFERALERCERLLSEQRTRDRAAASNALAFSNCCRANMLTKPVAEPDPPVPPPSSAGAG